MFQQVSDSSEATPQYAADTGDIVTNLKTDPEPMSTPAKYVAVKMKKSDLTVSNAAVKSNNDKVCTLI